MRKKHQPAVKTFSIAADRHHKAGVVGKMEYFTGEKKTQLQNYGNTEPSVVYVYLLSSLHDCVIILRHFVV